MAWISNHKHEIKEKSTKSYQSSSKVVGLGPVGISNTDVTWQEYIWKSNMRLVSQFAQLIGPLWRHVVWLNLVNIGSSNGFSLMAHGCYLHQQRYNQRGHLTFTQWEFCRKC